MAEIIRDLQTQNKIVAVIVTYSPDLALLSRLLDRVVPQTDAVVVVDNGDDARLQDWLADRANATVSLISLGENRGIAAAQNVGIEWARKFGADYIVFFDHDSAPAPDMVGVLLSAINERQQSGEKVAVVGPRFLDTNVPEHLQPPHFVQLQGWRFRRALCPLGHRALVLVDFLISSGSLVPLSVFDEVGLMNESLFIDHVDTEFSLRLKLAGYQSYGVPLAIMEHQIGDSSRRILGRNAPMHSALRHYYIIRNAVWIICQPWMQLSWRIALGVNTLRRFIFYILFATPRLQHLGMMIKGLRHALTGRMGRL